jgi:4-amino-4-deoxy-L-arabinose transferase-like glycosyltransferase
MTGRAALRRRAIAAGVLAVALGVAARSYWMTDPQPRFSDAYSYLLIARSIADGDGYDTGGSQHPSVTRSPLYPLLLAAASELAPSTESAAWVLSLALGALSAIPLALLARRIGGRAAAVAALGLASVSCLVASAGWGLPEPLYLLLFLSAASASWSASRAPTAARGALAGVLAGLTALTRPEGVVWIAILPLWLLAGTPAVAARLKGRFAAAGSAGALALAVYAPYALWASLSLGRFEPIPGITYLRDMRTVSDIYGLRDGSTPPKDWTERARFVTDASHRELLLNAWFLERRLVPPDPRFADVSRATERAGQSPLSVGALRRRRNIVLGNLVRIPAALAREHLLPIVPVALGAAGLVSLVRRRRVRALAFLAWIFAGTLAPFASHVEERFLYAPFAVGLAVAAVGWGALDRPMRHNLPARIGAHSVLLAAVALAVVRHPFPGRDARAEFRAQRRLGSEIARELPPGPVLAVRPAVPYWARRPYLPIPLGRPEDVLVYARTQGAVAIILETREDSRRRPELAPLLGDRPPEGFETVLDAPEAGGAPMRVLRILAEAPAP